MTLQRKLLLLGGFGAIPAIAVSVTGYQVIERLRQNVQQVLISSVSLRNHWEGDMMHDALRADVYAAVAEHAAANNTSSRSGVAEDAQRFRETLSRNRKLHLDPEIEAALAELEPRIEAYTREAEAIVDLAARDRTAAVGRIPHFQETFQTLDVAQDKVSDLMLRNAARVASEGDRKRRTGELMVFWILGVALLTLVAVAWFLSRSITRRLSLGLTSISERSQQVASAAAQISGGSQSLAQAASQQAAAIQETSASAEEIRATTHKNSDNSTMAARRTEETVRELENANHALSEMQTSMNGMVESASKVASIIQVIDGIAFQTNILALNAAVEAARAGAAGSGFAVVADEVRRLAQRSAEASKQTAELIEEAIGRTKAGKDKVDSISALMRTIAANAADVKQLSDSVHAGSSEQVQGVEEIVRSTAHMQGITQQIAANAEEHAASAEELTSQAASVDETIAGLLLAVGGIPTGGIERSSEDLEGGLFEWSPRFEIGVPVIDAQHKKLFERARQLHSAMKAGKARSVIQELLQHLIEYTETHFHDEEELMKRFGYPDFAAHKTRHDDLTRKVREFAAEFEAGRAQVSLELMTFLRDWLYRHILKSDSQYAPYVSESRPRETAGAR
ncbi:MAG: bacteriohemerythrin [Bryobacteraceae bacterium]